MAETSPTFVDSGLRDRAALVTGGSRGIGRAVVEHLAAEGARVVFLFRSDEEAANDVVESCRRAGGAVRAERVDVRDAEASAAAVERMIDTEGGIDVLVNNAAVIRDALLAALRRDELDDLLATNVAGVFHVTGAVVPHMVSRRSGKIVNVSSVAGARGGRGQTGYAATKGAIDALTRSLAVELAPRRIHVNAVAPGLVETEMSRDVRDRAGEEARARILLRRFGTPAEVARAVLFLASRHADYITGQVLAVDGGFRME